MQGKPTITVLARHYTENEEFWLGYRCRKCGLRFGNIQDMQRHSKIHQTIKLKKCENCGKKDQLQKHHIDYEDNITKWMCPKCHGKWHAKYTTNWGRSDRDLTTQSTNYFLASHT